MSDFANVDERGPFVQFIFKSVAVTVALVFALALALEWIRPELRASLFVPIGLATFIGAIGFQVEVARKQYVVAVLWVLAAFLLFPAAAWLLLLLTRIPPQSAEAKFVSLIPQAVAAPTLFMAAKKRFHTVSHAR
jgi:uncharacterized membrane protein